MWPVALVDTVSHRRPGTDPDEKSGGGGEGRAINYFFFLNIFE